MKQIIILIFLISSNGWSQSFEGIKSGLDSIALKNHIKSKFETLIEFDNINIDTIWTSKNDYFPNGYLRMY
jgi:hypothetical protein